MAAQPRPSRGWSDCGAVCFLIGVIWGGWFGINLAVTPRFCTLLRSLLPESPLHFLEAFVPELCGFVGTFLKGPGTTLDIRIVRVSLSCLIFHLLKQGLKSFECGGHVIEWLFYKRPAGNNPARMKFLDSFGDEFLGFLCLPHSRNRDLPILVQHFSAIGTDHLIPHGESARIKCLACYCEPLSVFFAVRTGVVSMCVAATIVAWAECHVVSSAPRFHHV